MLTITRSNLDSNKVNIYLIEPDTFPICLDTKDPKEIIKTVKYISPTFGGIIIFII